MSKGNAGGMLGIGGARNKLSRGALRGAGDRGRGAAGQQDAQRQRRELLEKMRERTRST
ncbi:MULTISPECIES: DUF6243 family protein [unclassified Streptomyces]|uniref:DUF6243 family protein n=1 Tax=unclassified Streptomyces TaxID=2593676 RepID=UPI0018F88485|nr:MULTISPECIES: DUF6243 family protein [unclassified Streptomyces]